MEERRRFRFRDWRILTKLLVVMLVLSWIPLSVAMALAVQSKTSAARTEMENYILNLVSGTVDEIEGSVVRFIRDNHDVVQTMAHDEEIVRFLEASPTERQGHQSGIDRPVADLVSSNPAIDDVAVYDPRGTAVASSRRYVGGHNDRVRDDVRAALAGEDYTGRIHIGPVGDAPAFFVSVPVKKGPQTIGAVAARLRADFILTSVTTALKGMQFGKKPCWRAAVRREESNVTPRSGRHDCQRPFLLSNRSATPC